MFIEPVSGSDFFGRGQVLGTLEKRLKALKGGYRRNIAITGPMLCGKSSILRHFMRGITDASIIPVYVEMDGEDFGVFAVRFMASLMAGYLISENIYTHEELMRELCSEDSVRTANGNEDFDKLFNIFCSFVPGTGNCAGSVIEHTKARKIDRAYEGLLALTSVLRSETGKSCIVIFDEFHNIANFGLKKPFQVFGHFIMVQKNTMYVVSSSQQTLLRDILSGKLDLLFGNFEVIEVNGFDGPTSDEFISLRMKNDFGDNTLKGYIIQMCQGNPFYLGAISDRMSLIMSENPECSEKECLFRAVSELLYSAEGVLNQYFTNTMNFFLEKKHRKRFVPILTSMAEGNSVMKDIQKGLGKADKDLGLKLSKLKEMDLVWQSGVFYKISDKLFEYWLLNVHAVKTRSVIDDMAFKYNDFRSSLEKDYENYRIFRSMGMSDLFCGMLGKFRGEKIDIGGQRRKLPVLKEIGPATDKNGVLGTRALCSPGEWIFHIKEKGLVGGKDIDVLNGESPGRNGTGPVKRVIVPLDGITEDASLMAKENNIWVWDKSGVNRIFRIFGRYELVI